MENTNYTNRRNVLLKNIREGIAAGTHHRSYITIGDGDYACYADVTEPKDSFIFSRLEIEGN